MPIRAPEVYYDRGNHVEFISLIKDLARPGELLQNTDYPFEFVNVEKPYESYTGANVKLRYFLRVTITRRLTDIVRELDLVVQTLSTYPEESNGSIKMEVGIEDCLHIEFEYSRCKYALGYLNVLVCMCVCGTSIARELDLVVQTLSTYREESNGSLKMEVGIEDCLHIEFEYSRCKYVLGHLNVLVCMCVCGMSIVRELDLVVQTLSTYPEESNGSIKMEVGIEDCLNIEFEYSRCKYVLGHQNVRVRYVRRS